jgi:hypothetical protein
MSRRILAQNALTRGAASVEAVVALPVFIILFIGVIFVRDLTGAKLEADAEARRCAWQYSSNGCTAVPPGCDHYVHTGSMGLDNPDVGGALNSAKDRISNGNLQAAILTSLTKVVLEPLTDAFTKNLEVSMPIDRQRPRLFGGGTSRVIGKYHLACNLESKTQDDIINQAWDFLIP